MRSRSPRICLLVGMNGSLSLHEAATAAQGIAEPILVIDRSEAAAFPGLGEVARSLGTELVLDMTDTGAVCDAMAAIGAAAVTTFVDAYCPVVDEVNRHVFGRAGVPGRWNKDVQRKLLADYGVSSVTNSRVSTRVDLAAAIADYGFPLVLKPVSGVASRDVWLLGNEAQAHEFASSVALGEQDLFVAEPYIGGSASMRRAPHRADYLSAELFATSASTTAFITDRPPLAMPCRETGIIGPSTVDTATEAAVLEKAWAAHEALGLGSGAFHVELKLTDRGPEVLEVNGRLGGYVRRLVRLGTGTDIAPSAVKTVLDVSEPFHLEWHRHVAALLLQPPRAAVRMQAVPRRREICSLPGILSVDHIAEVRSQLDWRVGTGGAVVKMWITGEGDEELRQRLTACAYWLADAFDFRDRYGQRVRDDEWLEELVGRGSSHSSRACADKEGTT
jgi:hypothetical protein